MTGIDNLAAQLQKTINEKDEGKKTGYDTQATVVKVSSDTIWVKIPGGVDETPVSKTVSAKEGDTVQVRVAGGRAWIVGNYTAPATDDTRAEEANTKAESADAHAAIAEVAAQGAQESAMTAQQAADVAKTRAIEAGKSAEEAKTMASEASAAAAKANTAANGAVTSLGVVQGVVDGLSVDMDEMQTHVAMMDAVVDPDSGKTLVPAGLHVVPTNNGYFVVLSNDGMYVYDNESDLVATFGENIKFDSIRPQRIGGDDAYIEYYDSDNDGKADSLRIVGANISSSTGIPTKVSELQNDSGYTTKTYVDDAVGDTATDLANYILSNDKAIDDLERQIDGAIDTWYYAVDPTTSNEPAKDWTTEALKESHLRDLYFNTSNGHTWRWAKDGSIYKWIQIEDADAIKALADAAKAQTTADVKKRVFISQPTPPYDVGDLWVGGSNGDIKKCKKAKTESQSYAAADWELASKYTDDSALNTFKTTTYATDLQQTNEAINLRATKTEVSEAIDDEIEAAKAEIKVTTDGISSEVVKKVGASEIISKINQSAETVQIEAEKIEFKGSVVFNAIKSQTDAAYDAKGSASAVQTNLDNLEIGGRNCYIIRDSVEGYLSSDGSGAISEMNADRQEHTSDYIAVTPGETITFQVWVTPSTTTSSEYLWMAYVLYDANKTGNGSRPAKTKGSAGVPQYDSYTIVIPDGIYYIRVSARMYQDGLIKVEHGNKATDWTPAPEDVDASIEDIADSAAENLVSTSAAIYQRIDSTDNEVATIQTNLAKYVNRTELTEVDAFVKKYLGDKGYVKVNNQGLVITQGQFSVVITGDRMIFQENGNSVAYLTNQKLFITKSEVTQEMKIANFVWSNRDGRLTLMLAE